MKGTSGQLPLRNPKPDIDAFKKIILGEALPERVHFAELFLDYEISESIGTDLLGQKWAVPEKDRDSRRKYWDNLIEVYYRLGYDYIRVSGGITSLAGFALQRIRGDFQEKPHMGRGGRRSHIVLRGV
jgi:uroporphyrinogen decarboxylase